MAVSGEPDHHVVSVQGDRRLYRVAVPFYETDAIQKRLAETGRPYEEEMLKAATPLIDEDSYVLDVGANIGNHTLYWATHATCRVIAFEPNPELCSALELSVLVNELNNVTVVRAGAGVASSRAEFIEHIPSNLGGQSLRLVDSGGIRVTTVDEEVPADASVSLIKIDVEGMELEVLRGARSVLLRSKPHLFVECATVESFDEIVAFLDDLGFGFVQTYNATPTHHFRPYATDAEHDLMRESARLARRVYELTDSERRSRQALDAANLKYREAIKAVDLAKESERHARAAAAEVPAGLARRAEEAEASLAETRETLSRRARNAEAAFSRVRGEALRLLQERDAERRRVAQATVKLNELTRELAAIKLTLKSSNLRAQRAVADLKRLRSRKAVRLAVYVTRVRRAVVRRLKGLGRRSAVSSGAVAPGPSSAPIAKYVRTVTVDVTQEARYASRLHAAQRAQGARDWFRQREHGTRRLRVAAIVDEFSANGLGPECELLNLDRTRWREQLDGFDADLLFVESAWRGAGGSWHNALPGVPQDFLEIRDWFTSRSIPTVFWNKEDPVHFDTFLPLAAECDFVFTTDLDRVPDYMRELAHDRVGVLPFASQPEIHHPLRTRPRKHALVFAGGYYRRYPARMRDLDEAIRGASEVLPVEIFDRQYGTILEDYAFPSRYDKYIVGTLAADEIDEAYKGYAYALNLNSVKDSTTMFARRVIELAMSGTPTVSNFARGVATLFGDTIPMSDQAGTLRDHLQRLEDEPNHRDRLATLANRKVLREHTYGVRLAMLSAAIRDEAFEVPLPTVGVISAVDDDEGLAQLEEVLDAQRHARLAVVVVCDDPRLAGLARRRGWEHIERKAAAGLTVSHVLPDLPVAVIDPRHAYGPEYLESLCHGFTYSNAVCTTKQDRFVSKDGRIQRQDEGVAFTRLDATVVAPHRSLFHAGVSEHLTIGSLLQQELPLESGATVIAVDPFDFCENGAAADDREATFGAIDSIDTGSSVAELLDAVSRYRRAFTPPTAWKVVARTSLPRSTPANSGIRLVRQGFDTLHLSRFADGPPATLWCMGRLPVDEVTTDGVLAVRVESLGSLRVGIVVRWFGGDGKAIGSATRPGNDNISLDVPDGTVSVQLGVRAAGTGTANVRYIAVGHRAPVGFLPVRSADTLLVADAYPSYDDLYRYGFVHTRVKNYRSRGLGLDVFRFQRADRRTFYEFEGVTVQSGNAEALREALASGVYKRVLVHFLSEELWAVLRDFSEDLWMTIWVHGAEVQPWWRRSYATDAEVEKAKVATVARLAFWRALLDDLPPRVGFVFVSEYFKWEVTTDLERSIPDDQVTVIHNPIDTSLFAFHEKSETDRLRILSIRPYANPKYANDLAVQAVVELSNEPWFDQLTFTFVGDGVLFDATVEPLRQFDNVTIHRGYLTHAEIAQAHREHGVFLVPTRVDAQGVSRDEAMSSGLVPVTSASTAVPEFVSEVEGYLAPEEDSSGLADAIRDMYHHPEVFVAKSAASAARVRRQTGSDIIIAKEVDYIKRDERTDPQS